MMCFLSQNETKNGIVNDIVNDTVNEVPKLTKTEQSVLSQATIDDIAAAVSKSKSTVNRTIKSLKAKGILARTGSDKTGFWNVKG